MAVAAAMAGLVGTTVGGITAMFYLTVLGLPPNLRVVVGSGVVGAIAAAWLWRSSSSPHIEGR